jgi:hypothetical protein
MATKKNKTAKGKAKTLAAKILSRKHASDVKGGYLAKGAHIKEVTLELWRAGGDTVKK